MRCSATELGSFKIIWMILHIRSLEPLQFQVFSLLGFPKIRAIFPVIFPRTNDELQIPQKYIDAGVLELVDNLDSKSSAVMACGFESRHRHQQTSPRSVSCGAFSCRLRLHTATPIARTMPAVPTSLAWISTPISTSDAHFIFDCSSRCV